MEGYLHLRINPWMRRLLTRIIAIVPAVIVILVYGEDDVDQLLIFSQVVLSLQLGFAVIPLIHFVSDRKTMGIFAIKPLVQIAAWLIAAILVYLNLSMVLGQATDYFRTSDNLFWKIVIIIAAAAFVALLLISIIYPLVKRKLGSMKVHLHPDAVDLKSLVIPSYKTIAVALDFSENDEKLLSHALGQGQNEANYVLIHIVESVPARLYEQDSDDEETEKDKQHLTFYKNQLTDRGFRADAKIGFGSRAKEIVRLVNDSKADMLVIGAHGHSGIKDLIYGQTINTVRHELKIPVLVVNI